MADNTLDGCDCFMFQLKASSPTSWAMHTNLPQIDKPRVLEREESRECLVWKGLGRRSRQEWKRKKMAPESILQIVTNIRPRLK